MGKADEAELSFGVQSGGLMHDVTVLLLPACLQPYDSRHLLRHIYAAENTSESSVLQYDTGQVAVPHSLSSRFDLRRAANGNFGRAPPLLEYVARSQLGREAHPTAMNHVIDKKHVSLMAETSS